MKLLFHAWYIFHRLAAFEITKTESILCFASHLSEISYLRSLPVFPPVLFFVEKTTKLYVHKLKLYRQEQRKRVRISVCLHLPGGFDWSAFYVLITLEIDLILRRKLRFVSYYISRIL
jgi:hypothetical protein